MRWNGRLDRKPVHDGRYLIRLVEGFKVLAETPLLIDTIAPRATNIRARTLDRMPFQHDKARVTTISPNGDGVRESAKISFTLSERAIVHFEVTRTISSPTTIYELKANLRPGQHTFTWQPDRSVGARTYLVRITTTDSSGNHRTYGDDNPRTGRRLKSAVVRILGVDAGFTAESYVASSAARLGIETDATALTLQTFRAGPEEGPTHSDTLMNGVPVDAAGDDPLGGTAPPRHAQLRDRTLADGCLLREADGERRSDRLRAVHHPPDDARRRQPHRGRAADEHVAGIQLPRRGRERLGRHVVCERGAEHCRARAHVHPARRAAAVAEVRRRLSPLAPCDWQAAGVSSPRPTSNRSVPSEELFALYDFVVFPGHTDT